MNPILPPGICIPDVEARTFSDGRIYLYGSTDIPANTEYGSHKYHVFSSDNLTDWVDHGVCFTSKDVHFDTTRRLFAPDCIYYNGLYYLFYCTADNREGVAVSENPWGPFRHGRPVQGPDGDSIDPAVLVDDDGSVYYFWGQFNLRGARMNEDMTGIDRSTLNVDILSEEEDGFHEGASIRKRSDIYYMIYTDTSRGRATCLAYATASAPLGPYTRRGIIIDNTGCDPETWNNHGSIEEFNGEWYVFYHRSSNASRFSRRVCIEKIQFNEDGSIDEVEMSSSGAEQILNPIDPIGAHRACQVSGNVRIAQHEHSETGHRREVLSMIEDGDVAVFKNLKLTPVLKKVHMRAASASDGGEVEIRLDSADGPILGNCQIEFTDGWSRWCDFSAPLESSLLTDDSRAVVFCFKGSWGRLFDVESFWFE